MSASLQKQPECCVAANDEKCHKPTYAVQQIASRIGERTSAHIEQLSGAEITSIWAAGANDLHDSAMCHSYNDRFREAGSLLAYGAHDTIFGPLIVR